MMLCWSCELWILVTNLKIWNFDLLCTLPLNLICYDNYVDVLMSLHVLGNKRVVNVQIDLILTDALSFFPHIYMHCTVNNLYQV